FADHRRGLVADHLLICTGLDELANPEATRVARRLARWQRMIRADHLIAVRDVGARAKKQRTIVLHVSKEIVRIASHDLVVLRGDAVSLPRHLFVRLASD